MKTLILSTAVLLASVSPSLASAADRPTHEGPTFSVLAANTKTEQSDLAFAQSELIRYEELLSTLTERADEESDPQTLKKFAGELKDLAKDLLTTKVAIARFKRCKALPAPGTSSVTELQAKEEMRESVNDLQDTSAHVVDALVAADERVEEQDRQREQRLKNAPPPVEIQSVNFTASR